MTSFARVTIEKIDDRDFNSGTPPDSPWFVDACRGVEDAWNLMGQRGDPWKALVVSRVEGTIVDTTPDAVRIAALLASLKCLGMPESDLPEFRLTESGWEATARQEESR
ncbi:MAG: hypothetical protein RLP09_43305 [Sandaracinaceae bacterium]